MVDYSINLTPNEKMDNQVRQKLQSQPHDLQTINQTMYGPVRYRPIAISIETKTPNTSEQEARTQLGMWTAAYFNRLRSFMHGDLKIPTLPQLYSSGSQWALLFACESSSHIVSFVPTSLFHQFSHHFRTYLGSLSSETRALYLIATSCSQFFVTYVVGRQQHSKIG